MNMYIHVLLQLEISMKIARILIFILYIFQHVDFISIMYIYIHNIGLLLEKLYKWP